jgi:transcriptional regulator with XRE-family HTH domain
MQRSTTHEDKALGERIRSRRLMAGLSQEKLGEALGVTFQQVQKYERGVNRVSAVRLGQIAGALGEGVSYFQPDSEGISKAGREMQSLMANPLILRMARALDAVEDRAMQLHLVQLVEKISGED